MPTPSNDEGALVASNERAASDARFAPAPHPDDDRDLWGAEIAGVRNPPSQRSMDTAEADDLPEADDDADDRDTEETLLEQLGGISGLIYSALPVVVFVPANALWGLGAAIWTALGVAAA